MLIIIMQQLGRIIKIEYIDKASGLLERIHDQKGWREGVEQVDVDSSHENIVASIRRIEMLGQGWI